jgi:hypothetical protein
MNKALETKIRALIAKERIVTTKALHAEWNAVDWVIFYAVAPFARDQAFADFLKDAKLRQALYPHLFKSVVKDPKELKSEAQGVHDFVADAESKLDNTHVFANLVTQIERWMEAYSMLLDTLSLFKARGLGTPQFTEAFSHIDASVRSSELGNETVTTDVNVLGKIFLQKDPDRMATLLNTSFRGANSRIKAFYSVGVPPEEAAEIMMLSEGIIGSYGKVLDTMADHIKFLHTLPFKRPASPVKQSDTANNRKKGDGKAGLNTKRHGKPKEGDSTQKPQRRSHQNAQGASRGNSAQPTKS